jgi:hypothetical protein
MEFVRFTFSSFWHFIGVAILIQVSGHAIAEIVKAIRQQVSQ